MRSHSRVVRIMVTLSLLAFAAACGGGGGGGGGGEGTAGLAAGAFTKNVFYAGGTSAGGDQFSTSLGSRYQSLYLTRDLKGAGKITSISYKYEFNNVVTAVSCPNVTIKMGHTQVSTLNGTFANNVNNGRGSLETVLNSAPVTIPAGSIGSYYTINLATPFYYNGVDNLVVEVARGAACTSEVGTRANVANPVYNGILHSDASSTASAGTAENLVLDTVFTFSGGDNAVEFGGTNNNDAPFYTGLDRMQMLFLADDIDGKGPITGIGFQVSGVTSAATYTYSLKMGHTIRTALTASFADNYAVGSPVTMAEQASFTIPAGLPARSYFWVPLTGTFNYNGKDNLIVDIDVSGASAITGLQMTYTTAGRRAAGPTGGQVASYALDTVTYHTKFRFNGGTMDVIGPNDGPVHVFGISAMGYQFLLHASELGTAGSINKLACRLYSSSSPVTYQNFTVALVHRSQSTLASTYATNIAGGTKVYDGPFTMPGGLLAGDWVEIPFTTAFNYDGTSNLVVETTTGGGSISQLCQISLDATRFDGRYMDTVSAGGPFDFRGNFRFWISK